MADKPERVPSNAELDLKARLGDDYKGESDLSTRTTTVQPNALGDEAYVGTDPIYQNHANDTEKPYASRGGPERAAERAFADQYPDLDDVDEELVVDDPGLGGKAVKTVSHLAQPDVPDVTVGASADVTHAGEDAAKDQRIADLESRVEELESGKSDDEDEDKDDGSTPPPPAPPTS